MTHLRAATNGDYVRAMRAIGADTEVSGLISPVQHQKCGQDWGQEPNGVRKGAEEQLSAA